MPRAIHGAGVEKVSWTPHELGTGRAVVDFGVGIPHYGGTLSVADLRKTVERAEAIGYHSAWVSDHVITPKSFLSRVGPTFYDSFVVLSHIAAFTSRLRLGTSVIVIPYRNPLVTAKMVSTLDAMSDGRVIFGVGAGNMPEEFQALGVPEKGHGLRTDEYLHAMTTLWMQEPASFSGRFVQFSDVHFQPKPAQQPHPPIWVGGHSNAALRRAVRFGAAWHAGGMALERMAQTVVEIRRLAAEAGRTDGPAITTRLGVRFVDTNDTGVRNPGQGSPEQIREDVSRYRELGVSTVVCGFGPCLGPDFLAAMERFAAEIAPHFA
ncbi:MAG: LLM class F420-dependent oxidoreductase [Dehalococcoidia bacterium]|nr:LLM class F420-dependent oxidoreductase [Dehalococcoidia bacterium]